ncbi:MAG TPA: phosphopantothenoylcysteine decarboxylase [Kiritimatiellia bacterium]|nr:phosphopantothenoylcysteine decarboxylase [Kiritimatiellia bacterium]
MNVLVTAGPTREAIDPVRFVSNRSSGKMGYALAAAARARGHAVCLVSGPVALEPPRGVEVVRVTTAADMLAAVRKRVRACDLLVMAAAVADWRPKNPARRKLKKSAGPPRIAWEPTPDILQTLAPLKKKSQTFCGFAAETHALAREARRKLRAKNLDAIAANDVSKNDRGFEAERNALTIFFADGRVARVALATKTKCAATLLRALEEISAAKKK